MSGPTTYADWQRHRACDRKRHHASMLAANARVLELWARGRWARDYRCGWCDGFHVTSDREEGRT